MAKKNYEKLPAFPDYIVSKIRIVLANSIGDVDRIPEMGAYKLTENLIPESMRFERMVLRKLWYCHEHKIEPTEENIFELLTYEDLMPEEQLRKQFINLLSQRTENNMVLTSAMGLHEWIQQQRMASALQDAANIVLSSAKITDAMPKVLEIIRANSPRISSISLYDEMQIFQQWQQEQIERVKRAESGQSYGVQFPWAGLRRKIQTWLPGEMGCIIGKSGHGKSTVAYFLSKYWAYELGGFNVLFIHLETNALTFMDRNIVSQLLVPMWILRNRKYHPNDSSRPDAMKVFRFEDFGLDQEVEKIEKYIKERSRTHGRIFYAHAPNASLSEIDSLIEESKGLSEAEGRELIVVIDYYNEVFATGAFDSESSKNNYVATQLKYMAESYGVYLLALAQDDIDNSGGKKRPYNGQRIFHRSQWVIRTERSEAKENKPLLSSDGSPVKNAFGHPIYLHKKGQLDSKVIWNVIKVNNGEVGSDFFTYICNEYFFIVGD